MNFISLLVKIKKIINPSKRNNDKAQNAAYVFKADLVQDSGNTFVPFASKFSMRGIVVVCNPFPMNI